MKENDFMLINQNVIHAIRETTKEDLVIKMSMPIDFLKSDLSFMNISSEILQNFFQQSLLATNDYYNYIIFREKKEKQVKAMIDRILLEYYQEKQCYDLAIKNYLYLLFIELLRDMKTYETKYYKKSNDSVDMIEIIEYVSQNCRDVTLKNLALTFGYSEGYLSRQIHQKTGKTFQAIVREERLKLIELLLKDTTLPIEQIAERVGYKNQTNLFRVIKEVHNMTPSQYRSKTIGEV